MSTNNERIIAKVKKLLMLAKSASNEHEAANALNQAQNLMAKYKLSDLDIDLASISSDFSEVKIKKPAAWQVNLVVVIAKTFGVEPIWKRRWHTSEVTFIGVTPRPELAKYCWEVLFPKLTKARSDFVKTLNNRMKRSTKIARGDTFALHWVDAISTQVEALAIDDKTKALMTKYTERNHGELTTTSGRQTKAKNDRGSDEAASAGRFAGSQESIHSPVNGREQAKLR